MATSGPNGEVTLWDTTSWQERVRFKDHTDRVRSLAFSPDGTVLATGSSDLTVRLYRAPR